MKFKTYRIVFLYLKGLKQVVLWKVTRVYPEDQPHCRAASPRVLVLWSNEDTGCHWTTTSCRGVATGDTELAIPRLSSS